MNHLFLQAMMASLPPEVKTQLETMKAQLEKDGTATGVFEIPNVGPCSVTLSRIYPVKDGQMVKG